ncbi:MAG: hypothetical protein AAF492_20305, partial [Verrucomicrobiota bacterium]
EIWDYFLREANHTPRKSSGRVIERGQLVRSYEQILEDLHWRVGYRKEKYSNHQCETAMKWLAKRGMIQKAKTTRGMVITICNYDLYQSALNYENHTESHRETRGEPDESQTINKNESKEEGILPLLLLDDGDDPGSYTSKKGRMLYGEILTWFDAFWDAFDYRRGKAEAADAFLSISGLDHTLVYEQVVPAARREAESRSSKLSNGQTPKMAQGWLTGRRWEDEVLPSKRSLEDDFGERARRRSQNRKQGLQ